MEQDENPVSVPLIGDIAPSFSGMSTEGPLRFPEDYKGRWVIIFSHPSDFTPVCTSELITFAGMQSDFDRLGCSLIGISVDSLACHIAWLNHIENNIEYRGMKNLKVSFPLVDDLSQKISRKYGMLQPAVSDTNPVRALFFIDPGVRVRALMYYPRSLGRNFKEIYRALVALQASDAFGVMIPADWCPGDDVITPPASTIGKARSMMEGKRAASCQSFYFCSEPFLKEDLLKKLTKK